MSENLKVFGKTYTGVTGIQAKDIDGLNILFSSDWYDIDSGDIIALFDQYAEENNMLIMELTIASAQTDYWTVEHSLGRIPTEALLYPKSIANSSSAYSGGYIIGWVTSGLWGMDKTGNRTIVVDVWGQPSDPSIIWYPSAKNLPSLMFSSFKRTDYNFTKSAPTSTTVEFRGGTNNNTKLLAGEYKLALR